MRSRSDQFPLLTAMMAAALVVLASLAPDAAHALAPDAARAQTGAVGRIGPHTVGSKLAEVRAYPKTGDCLIDQSGADCTFVAPDGVEYAVLGDSVTTVIAKEKSARDVTLPFGLKFGDSLATALPKLIAQGKHWNLSTPDEGPKDAIFLSSEDVYPGENGVTFGVDVYFEHDRLVRVDYDSGEGD
jgi:hypothetical protein